MTSQTRNETFPPIPAGWRPAAWAEHLRQLAERCRADHPESASRYDAWAASLDAEAEVMADET